MTTSSGNPRYSIAGQAPRFPVLQPTGTCTICGRMDLRHTAAGNVWAHGPGGGCPGAGKTPKEQS